MWTVGTYCGNKQEFRNWKCQAAPRIVRYNYNPLKQSEELQEKYSVEVRNRFSLLLNQEPEEQHNPTAAYGKFMDAVHETNKKLLEHIPQRQRYDPSKDVRVAERRMNLFKAKEDYHSDPSEETRDLVRDCKEALESAYAVVAKEFLSSKIRQAEIAADRCKNKESWALINDITGQKRKSSSLIDGGSAEGRLKNWQEHFKKRLGQPPVVPDEKMEVPTVHPPKDIRIDHSSTEELLEAPKTIKEGKNFGEDSIAPEILKRVGLDDLILRICNRALDDESVPDQWWQLNIVPVPNKGNLTKVDNYRGIALTSIVSKTLNRMILNRIRSAMENVLRINQNVSGKDVVPPATYCVFGGFWKGLR
ncbi:hypothetical protein ACHWQZ_G003058 [Mnemiopsis leidyi]